MGYNKRQFTKANDKKVLHKVRKHWVVISMALLMAIGGKAAASHVSAHADTTNNNATLTNRINHNLDQSKSTLTSVKAQSNNQANNVNTSKNSQSANSTKNITNAANVLHQRILQNANQKYSVKQPSRINTNTVKNTSAVKTQLGSIEQNVTSNSNNHNSASQNTNMTMSNPNTNANNQTMGTTAQVTPHYVGDDDLAGHIDVKWIDESDGDPINSDTSDVEPGVSATAEIDGWEHTFSGDSTYEFDPGARNSNGGIVYNNNPSNTVPSTFQSGSNSYDIMVKKRPVIHNDILVEYQDQDRDDNGAIISTKNYSDAQNAQFTQLDNDEKVAPFGFYYDGQVISHDGIDDLSNIKFTPGTHVIKLGVKLRNNAAPTENVAYLDIKDGYTPVDGKTFTGQTGQPINAGEIGYLNSHTPASYTFVSDASTNSGTFTNGGTFAIDVKPNGIVPPTPTPQPDHSYATVDFINEDNNQDVHTTVLYGKNNDPFNLLNSQPENVNQMVPAGWNVDSSRMFGGDSLPVTNFGARPNAKVYVTPSSNPNPSDNVTASIVYEDENNNDQPIPNATINITGKANSTINYANYTKFLPSDCVYEGLGTHDNQLENGEQNVVLVKHINTSAPGDVNIHYVDHNDNSDVADDTIAGNTLNYGSNINVTDYHDKNGTEHKTLPSGYKVANNQNVNTTINSNTQNMTVEVEGDPSQSVNDSFTLVPVKVSDGGTKTSDNADARTINISGVRGSTHAINLSNYAPAHYVVAPNDAANVKINNSGQVVQLNNNGTTSALAAGNKMKVDYDEVAPVTVNYINTNDHNPATRKISSEQISANEGQTVDVTKNAAQTGSEGDGLPNGYSDVGGQTTQYKVGNEPLTINYLVQGKMVNVSYSVGRNTNNGALGQPNGHLGDYTVNTHKRVGDIVKVTPTDQGIRPDSQAYSLDPSNDPSDSAKVTYAGGSNGSVAQNKHDANGNPTLATYTYDANSVVNNVTPIEIEYVNQDGDVVAHHEDKANKQDPASPYQLGSDINAIDPNHGGFQLPASLANDYTLDDPSGDYEYSFNTTKDGKASDGSDAQIARIGVTGKTINNVSYDVKAYKMKNGNVDGAPVDHPVSNQTARIGDHININPASYNPNSSNYTPSYSDAGAYLVVNSDGQTTPSTQGASAGQPLNLHYNIKQSYVTVNYLDESKPDNPKITGTTQNVEGNIGDSFNESQYENNIPVGYTFDHADSNVNNFTSSNQTVNMYLQEQDTATIKFVDKGDDNDGSVVDQRTYSADPTANGGMIPASYFQTPPDYNFTSPTSYDQNNHVYTGDRILANGKTFTVYVKNAHVHPVNPVNPANEGEIDVYYVNRNTDNGQPFDHKNDSTTKMIRTYGNYSAQQSLDSAQYVNSFAAAGAQGVTPWGGNSAYYYESSPQSYYIEYSQAPTQNISNQIVYEDVNKPEGNGFKRVGSPITISGKFGNPINYSDFQNYPPTGYVYDNHMLDHEDSFVDNGAQDIILVRGEEPDQTFGSVDINYVWANGYPNAGSKAGTSNHKMGETGTHYPASQLINAVPSDTIYAGIKGGDSVIPAFYPNNTPDHPTTLTVYVKPAPKEFTTYTLHYEDQNGNPIQGINDQKATGRTGDPFNFSAYEYDIPGSGKYGFAGLSYNGGSTMPTTYNGTDGTIDIKLRRNND